ncbi:MAG: hypothetical protein ACI9CB_001038 [Rhodothermales bacterium]|jgi:hypothetical protein
MRRITRYYLLLLLVLLNATAWAAPVGFSVNSDGGDILHRIDLFNGTSIPLGAEFTDNTDIEGLAIAPDSTLWAVDEDSFSMFQINPITGFKLLGTEVSIKGTAANIFNDFGLTFSCDGTLYASSVTSKTLYTIDKAGVATVVGGLSKLGFNISALASFGDNPTILYGLGNGLLSENDSSPDNRSLFEINLDTGIATPIGTGIGGQVAAYHEAGLSFDDDGVLWGISDRSLLGGLNSEIFTIDTVSGVAAWKAETIGITGFESLAIAPPGGCSIDGGNQNDDHSVEPIPAMGNLGALLTILALMLTGFTVLRRPLS